MTVLRTENKRQQKKILWLVLSFLVITALIYVFTNNAGLSLLIGGLGVIAEYLLYLLIIETVEKPLQDNALADPAVFWFTGLSGAGKATLAKALLKQISRRGYPVEFLDGDNIRNIFPKTGFTKEERDRHIRRIGFLAGILERNGISVIASFISPYRESRNFVRKQCRNYIEIYVSTPLDICELRDTKGLYAKARAGEIRLFTGIDDPYEEPENPEITIDTSERSVDDCVREIMEKIYKVTKSRERRGERAMMR